MFFIKKINPMEEIEILDEGRWRWVIRGGKKIKKPVRKDGYKIVYTNDAKTSFKYVKIKPSDSLKRSKVLKKAWKSNKASRVRASQRRLKKSLKKRASVGL